MITSLTLDGTRFLINDRPTCEGRSYRGRSIEGLLFNSRMVQAIFDDECPQTRLNWCYPDSGCWDPDRNTDEFCAMLPTYRSYGLHAVTVGLQGGGSSYAPGIYDHYRSSGFTPEGELKPAFLARLRRVLTAADEAGVVVIVNYFYFQMARHFLDNAAVVRATEAITDWLLHTGFRNLLVDVVNECGAHWKHEICRPEGVHRLIECVQQTTLGGRRLPASASAWAHDAIPHGRWLAVGDMAMPHGNDCTPERLTAKIDRMLLLDEYQRSPRPVLINEDSIHLDNFEEATQRGWSWGFYAQGFGSHGKDARTDWGLQPRETEYARLSGFQTLPVNWGINSIEKQAFFTKLREISGGV